MAKIKNIRVSISDKNKKLREIFKISVTINKSDFILVKRNGDIKITFHKEGKKFLRLLKHKRNLTLYEHKHYDIQNLNPIFAFLPKKIETYAILDEEKNNGIADVKILNESKTEDIIIKVYWVNYVDAGIYIQNEDKNISNFLISGHKNDGTPYINESPICLLDFGQQKLYFDFYGINRKGFNNKYEKIFLFEPGLKLNINKYLTSIKPPHHENKIKENGYEIYKNKNDNTYIITF